MMDHGKEDSIEHGSRISIEQ